MRPAHHAGNRALLLISIAAFVNAKGDVSLCDNSCKFSRDGECDDSGPKSESSSCALGTDCSDCGTREEKDLGAFICSNACYSRDDGHCDDGGPGTKFKGSCGFGHDCQDCGPRMAGSDCINGRFNLCGTGCMFSNDGKCDDGGFGSRYESCTFGSDCADCPPRDLECSALSSGEVNDASVSPPPMMPPTPCVATVGKGAGPTVPTCTLGRCDGTSDCHRCDCAGCDFCKVAFTAVDLPSIPPPPPSPAPPFEFDCSMLQGRQNLRTQPTKSWCYVQTTSDCESSFTYDEEVELSLCKLSGAQCMPVAVDRDRRLDIKTAECQKWLQFPPMPPVMPPAPLPSAPPPDLPPPSPPPVPCVPLSGKCGGKGWTGVTNCCADPAGVEVHCFAKSPYHSQCRTSCNMPGWDCNASPPPSHSPPSHSPAAARQKAAKSSPPPPSPLLVSPPSASPLLSSPSPLVSPPSLRMATPPSEAQAHAAAQSQPEPDAPAQQTQPKLSKPGKDKSTGGHKDEEDAGTQGEMDQILNPKMIMRNPIGSLVLILVGGLGGSILTYCCCVVARVTKARYQQVNRITS